MSVAWAAIFIGFATEIDITFVQVVMAVIGIIWLVIAIADVGCMMFFRNGRTLHDYIFNTHVVLGSKN